jgi:hypothetical protein
MPSPTRPEATSASPSRASASNSRSTSANRLAIVSAEAAHLSRSEASRENGADPGPASRARRTPPPPPAGSRLDPSIRSRPRSCRGRCRAGRQASARRRLPARAYPRADRPRTHAPSARSTARTRPQSGLPRSSHREPPASPRARGPARSTNAPSPSRPQRAPPDHSAQGRPRPPSPWAHNPSGRSAGEPLTPRASVLPADASGRLGSGASDYRCGREGSVRASAGITLLSSEAGARPHMVRGARSAVDRRGFSDGLLPVELSVGG